MCTHYIDDLLPHAPLHCAAAGEMVKGSYYNYILQIAYSAVQHAAKVYYTSYRYLGIISVNGNNLSMVILNT